MPFASPRFAGDPVLEDILGDPDTGTRKLEKGSPSESVTKVQEALFDLTWASRIVPPVTDRATFVDGDYGPATTSAVLAYKTKYKIYFPPSAPSGSYDGFTGPRTLQRLDQQCTLLDGSAAAIEAKAEELRARGMPVELLSRIAPQFGTPGAVRHGVVQDIAITILHKRSLGAFEVHGAILESYMDRGFCTGPLGFPVTDEHDDVAGFTRNDFENGALRYDPVSGDVSEVDRDPSLAF